MTKRQILGLPNFEGRANNEKVLFPGEKITPNGIKVRRGCVDTRFVEPFDSLEKKAGILVRLTSPCYSQPKPSSLEPSLEFYGETDLAKCDEIYQAIEATQQEPCFASARAHVLINNAGIFPKDLAPVLDQLSNPFSLEEAVITDFAIGTAVQDHIVKRAIDAKKTNVDARWEDYVELAQDFFSQSYSKKLIAQKTRLGRKRLKGKKGRSITFYILWSEESPRLVLTPYPNGYGTAYFSDVDGGSFGREITGAIQNVLTYKKRGNKLKVDWASHNRIVNKYGEFKEHEGKYAAKAHRRFVSRMRKAGFTPDDEADVIKGKRALEELCKRFLPAKATCEVHWGDFLSGSTVIYGERKVADYREMNDFFLVGRAHGEKPSPDKDCFLENPDEVSYVIGKNENSLLTGEQHHFGFPFNYRYLLVKE